MQPGAMSGVPLQIGYTLMCEQSDPRTLVADAVGAERAGFDFAVISDHFSPWLNEQGHSPFAWSVLAAAVQATTTLPFATFVTCPTMRYHPVIVAQMAATTALLAGDRFMLGLGSGENLNEHVIGRGWPTTTVRHAMLTEAVEIIRTLWTGHPVDLTGAHFSVAAGRLYDLPPTPPPVGIAASGPASAGLAGRLGDALIAVEPDAELVAAFAAAGGADKPVWGQLPICYDPDPAAAVSRAHQQFRWFGGGWPVNAELPGPRSFDAATRFVTEADVAAAIPCGPDVEAVTAAAAQWQAAGFTHLALVQIGGEHQREFLQWAADQLLPALRKNLST
jgi:G6PDH family F420-dependent oxidoreductase